MAMITTEAVLKSGTVRSGSRVTTDYRVVVVDDCRLRRESLTNFLGRHAAEVGAAWDQESLAAACERYRPKVIVVSMTCHDAAALLRRAIELCGARRIVVFSLCEDEEDTIVKCVEAGVGGYHLRAESLEALWTAIATVARGESACPHSVSAVLLRRMSEMASHRSSSEDSLLTTREEEILNLLRMGLSNREIADQLCIAVHTVKNHVHNLLTKLGVRSRAEAAARFRNGVAYGGV